MDGNAFVWSFIRSWSVQPAWGLKTAEGSGCNGSVIGRAEDRIINGVRGEEIKIQMTVGTVAWCRRLWSIQGTSKAAKAPPEKRSEKCFFFILIFPERRKSFKEYQRKEKILQMAPRCLHQQLYIHFFPLRLSRAARWRDNRRQESVFLIYWTNWLFFLNVSTLIWIQTFWSSS